MKKIIALLLAIAMLATLTLPCVFAEAPADETCKYWGDMDEDGKVTSADARLVLRHSVGLQDNPEGYPEDVLYKCDIDQDGKISSSDARSVLRLSVGLDEFPAHELLKGVGKDATCTEDGLTDGLFCIICGTTFEPQEVVPATGHKEVTDEAVAATCTEDGLTEGKHCEVCGEVFTAQETVPALGHDPMAVPADSKEVCEPAQVCARCGEPLSEAVMHEYNAKTITVENGVVCTRCGEVRTPSFNDLVNPLKQAPHTFTTFSQTTETLGKTEATGLIKALMALYPSLKEEFETLIEESESREPVYTILSEKMEVNPNLFEIYGSDKVSLLSDNDASVKTEIVNGVDFLKNLPDTISVGYRSSDLTAIKAKTFGDVLKVTVTLKPETYSKLADQGGVNAIDRIASQYGVNIRSFMSEMASMNSEMMRCDADCTSNLTVTYYFEPEYFSPIAAIYDLNMDMKQSISIDLSGQPIDQNEQGNQFDFLKFINETTGSINMQMIANSTSFYFFDEYFD